MLGRERCLQLGGAGHRCWAQTLSGQQVAEAHCSHPLSPFSLHQPPCELGNSGDLAWGALGRLCWPVCAGGCGICHPPVCVCRGRARTITHQAQQPQIPLFRLLLISNERPCLGVMSACCEEDSCTHPMRNEFISLPTAPAKMPDFLGK